MEQRTFWIVVLVVLVCLGVFWWLHSHPPKSCDEPKKKKKKPCKPKRKRRQASPKCSPPQVPQVTDSIPPQVSGDELGFQVIVCDIAPLTTVMEASTRPHSISAATAASSITLGTVTSQNWAGYAVLGKNITMAQGYCTVPTAKTTDTSSLANWVGIDGYDNGYVEQAGIILISGKIVPFFEMYPYPAYTFNMPVGPNDTCYVIVQYTTNGRFTIRFYNITQRKSTIIPQSYTINPRAPRTSAEYITEAPTLVNSNGNTILNLPSFTNDVFTKCTCTVNGVTGAINDSHWTNNKINMVNASNQVICSTGPLTANGQGFTETYV